MEIFDVTQFGMKHRQLTLYLNNRYGIENVFGHRDINPDECPGELAMPAVSELDRILKNENSFR